MSSDIAALVARFRETESRDRRGPAFKGVALALESRMRSETLTKHTILECFGPPDLFDEDVFVYWFDHDQPGRNKDEWYFDFQHGRLYGSGYNERGINDLSDLKGSSQFPSDS